MEREPSTGLRAFSLSTRADLSANLTKNFHSTQQYKKNLKFTGRRPVIMTKPQASAWGKSYTLSSLGEAIRELLIVNHYPLVISVSNVCILLAVAEAEAVNDAGVSASSLSFSIFFSSVKSWQSATRVKQFSSNSGHSVRSTRVCNESKARAILNAARVSWL